MNQIDWNDDVHVLKVVVRVVAARRAANLTGAFTIALPEEHPNELTILEAQRIPEEAAETLADRDPPAWVYLHGVVSPQSSSAIRAARKTSPQSSQ